MKYSIDFSIFESPVKAFGNVTGEIDLPNPPKVGEEVLLFQDQQVFLEKMPSGQKIRSITAMPESLVIELDDIVLESRREAEKVANFLEKSLNLFVVNYDDI